MPFTETGCEMLKSKLVAAFTASLVMTDGARYYHAMIDAFAESVVLNLK